MAVFTLLDLTKVFSINNMCIWPPWAWWSPGGGGDRLLFGQPKYYGRPGWERVPTAQP